MERKKRALEQANIEEIEKRKRKIEDAEIIKEKKNQEDVQIDDMFKFLEPESNFDAPQPSRFIVIKQNSKMFIIHFIESTLF